MCPIYLLGSSQKIIKNKNIPNFLYNYNIDQLLLYILSQIIQIILNEKSDLGREKMKLKKIIIIRKLEDMQNFSAIMITF